MMNQTGAGAGPDVRLRTMRILWLMFLITVGLLILVAYITRSGAGARRG